MHEWWLFYMTRLPHIQKWVYVSSPSFWVTAWPIECDRRDARWLPRLGHNRPCSFILPNRTLVLRSFPKPPPKNSDYPANAMLAGSQVGSILNIPSQAQPFRNPCRSVSHLLPSRATYLSARHHWVTSDGTIKEDHPAKPCPNFPPTKCEILWSGYCLKSLSGLLHNKTYLEKHIP